jgi:hypothetical protein
MTGGESGLSAVGIIGRKTDPVTITSAAECWRNYRASENQEIQ